MKHLFAAALLVSVPAFADAYWSCQCFESTKAADATGGVEIDTTVAETLKEAKKEAVEVCKSDIDPKTKVAECQHFVRTDH